MIDSTTTTIAAPIGRLQDRFTGLCSSVAATADARLEATGWGGLFYLVNSTRPWWRVVAFRDAQLGPRHRPGWTLQVGKWELVRDGRGPIETVSATTDCGARAYG